MELRNSQIADEEAGDYAASRTRYIYSSVQNDTAECLIRDTKTISRSENLPAQTEGFLHALHVHGRRSSHVGSGHSGILRSCGGFFALHAGTLRNRLGTKSETHV